jgi:hypothetical protein
VKENKLHSTRNPEQKAFPQDGIKLQLGDDSASKAQSALDSVK